MGSTGAFPAADMVPAVLLSVPSMPLRKQDSNILLDTGLYLHVATSIVTYDYALHVGC